ncbi:MAG: dUTP diphosphatase, partial [Bdellovibrio sp. CG_4_9_14_3_um_filter_39_7]
MDQIKVKVKKLEHFDNSFQLPRYETMGAAGADIRASLPAESKEEGIVIKPGERILIPTGLAMEIPLGFEIQVRPRSGLSFKTGLMVCNSPGTIDSDYRGEIKIILGN